MIRVWNSSWPPPRASDDEADPVSCRWNWLGEGVPALLCLRGTTAAEEDGVDKGRELDEEGA